MQSCSKDLPVFPHLSRQSGLFGVEIRPYRRICNIVAQSSPSKRSLLISLTRITVVTIVGDGRAHSTACRSVNVGGEDGHSPVDISQGFTCNYRGSFAQVTVATPLMPISYVVRSRNARRLRGRSSLVYPSQMSSRVTLYNLVLNLRVQAVQLPQYRTV